MSLNVIPTTIPHVFRIDIEGNGMAHECAVLQEDVHGNLLYLKVADLDTIDRERLGKILHHRFIRQLPLWDVMSQTTLKNNVNALEYFSQLVKGITKDGKRYVPRPGVRGYSVNQTIEAAKLAEAERQKSQEADESEETEARRGPGRPAKK